MNPASQQAQDYMNKKRAKNTCDKFKYSVKVVHQDGSFFFFESAYIEEKKFGDFDMLLVYSEHCGYMHFYKDDLESWRVYKYK